MGKPQTECSPLSSRYPLRVPAHACRPTLPQLRTPLSGSLPKSACVPQPDVRAVAVDQTTRGWLHSVRGTSACSTARLQQQGTARGPPRSEVLTRQKTWGRGGCRAEGRIPGVEVTCAGSAQVHGNPHALNRRQRQHGRQRVPAAAIECNSTQLIPSRAFQHPNA
jgi:hypothetical protein